MSDEILDFSEALERVQEDRELLGELFEIFQEDFVEKRKEMTKMFESSNFLELKNLAHSMKGASSNISAKRLYESLAQLEDIAEEGDTNAINPILKNIDTQYQELQEQIKKLKQELESS